MILCIIHLRIVVMVIKNIFFFFQRFKANFSEKFTNLGLMIGHRKKLLIPKNWKYLIFFPHYYILFYIRYFIFIFDIFISFSP